MNRQPPTNNSQGFTLLEVLIVIAVLAIGILAVMTMQISATNSNANARRMTEGANYLSSAFEWLMLEEYDDAAAIYDMGPDPDPPYTAQNVVAAGPIPNTQQVDVTVDLGPLGRPLTATYYKADPF
jgi:prepilin-type N-terminal cleavage/methylation domain-containing protein